MRCCCLSRYNFQGTIQKPESLAGHSSLADRDDSVCTVVVAAAQKPADGNQKTCRGLAQDQSESVGNAMNEAALTQYRQQWDNLKTALGENYEVHELALATRYAKRLDFNFTDRSATCRKPCVVFMTSAAKTSAPW